MANTQLNNLYKEQRELLNNTHMPRELKAKSLNVINNSIAKILKKEDYKNIFLEIVIIPPIKLYKFIVWLFKN